MCSSNKYPISVYQSDFCSADKQNLWQAVMSTLDNGGKQKIPPGPGNNLPLPNQNGPVTPISKKVPCVCTVNGELPQKQQVELRQDPPRNDCEINNYTYTPNDRLIININLCNQNEVAKEDTDGCC